MPKPSDIIAPFALNPTMLLSQLQGLEAAAGVTKLDPDNAEVVKLVVSLEEGLAARKAREAKAAAAEEAEAEGHRQLWATCTAHGATLGPALAADGYTGAASDKLPALDSDGSLEWPVTLLYPEYLQSDFLAAVDESAPLSEALAVVFPLEGPPPLWDERRAYTCASLVVYLLLDAMPPFTSAQDWAAWCRLKRAAKGEIGGLSAEAASKTLRSLETRTRVHDDDQQWLRVPLGLPLGVLLRHKGHIVPGGIVTLHVYPETAAAHAAFLTKHGGRVKDYLPEPPPPAK